MKKSPVAAFGKLPYYPEFLRHHLKGPTADFRRWVDAAHRFFTQGGCKYDASREPRRLLLRLGDENLVAAIGVNSSDAAGRRFPFFLFVTLSPDDLEVGNVAGALEPLWGELAATLERLRDAGSADRFHQETQELFVGTDFPCYRPERDAGPPLREWVQALHVENADYLWILGLWRVACMTDTNTAIRVPLSKSLPAGVQTDWWHALLACLHAPLQNTPSLVLPTSKDPEYAVTFLLRHPDSADYRMIMGGDVDTAALTDLTRDGGSVRLEGFETFHEKIANGPLAENAPMNAVVKEKFWCHP